MTNKTNPEMATDTTIDTVTEIATKKKRNKTIVSTITNIFSLLIIAGGVISLALLLIFPDKLIALIDILKEDILTLGRKNYLLAGLISIVESLPFLNLIFPGIIIILAIAGFVAQTDFWGIAGVITLSTIIGDIIAYRIGTKQGRRLLESHAETFGLTQERIKKIRSILAKNDTVAILASKRTNYTRGIIPFFSGIAHTNWGKFTITNLIGSIVYGLSITRLAKIFLGNYAIVMNYLRYIIIAILILTVIRYSITYLKQKGKKQSD